MIRRRLPSRSPRPPATPTTAPAPFHRRFTAARDEIAASVPTPRALTGDEAHTFADHEVVPKDKAAAPTDLAAPAPKPNPPATAAPDAADAEAPLP